MSARSRDKFLDAVLKEVRFSWDHSKIKEELNDHIDAHIEDLIEEGLDEEEALHIALESMGDAHEIGVELNEVHKPFWGWMLFFSRLALGIVVLSLIFSIVIPSIKSLFNPETQYELTYKNSLSFNGIEITHSEKVNLTYDFGSYKYEIQSLDEADNGLIYICVEVKPKNPFHLFNDVLPNALPTVYVNGELKVLQHEFWNLGGFYTYSTEFNDSIEEIEIVMGSTSHTVTYKGGQ